ncbi:PREDICTED: serine-rich adhesin for platelets-like isoform X1 [Eufriesea mexicana]|uniref:serine-rich adhesin for platelets-like isoform X1 n=2 Tax=Eufriesea mexicana TaxID=516756 RepID=UPI00083C0FAE|nr:PREDICTED: serine-rich adhesin for platelets-like isoform X1 [Eufriesea mexicana]
MHVHKEKPICYLFARQRFSLYFLPNENSRGYIKIVFFRTRDFSLDLCYNTETVFCRYRHYHRRPGGAIRKMSGMGKRTYLREVNPYLICPLCRGYLIDATTVVECLHSFCRSCILKHLNTEAHCPSCKHVLNKAKPNIKADKALQDIVYKLVPGLYHKEMRKRREFYKKHPEHADLATPEQRGEDVSGRLIFAPEDAVSLSLEYLPPGADPLTILLSTNDDTNNSNASNNQNNSGNNGSNNSSSNSTSNHGTNTTSNRRYLQCPALVTIAHLKKFLALKYSVDMTRYTIEICHRRAPLPEHWTLMDVAYIYAWKRNAPMRFFYRVALEEQRLEAPPHDRPSTPGLGASFPPVDASVATQDNVISDNPENDVESRPETERTNDDDEKPVSDNQNQVSSEKQRAPNDQTSINEVKKVTIKEEQPSSSVATSTTATSTTATSTTISTVSTSIASTTTVTNAITSSTPSSENKQIKTPIKILKNSDGRYEVLRSPPGSWNMKEQSTTSIETKPANPEFSVVSIGSGQNSNGVKITLKQCSPNNTSPNKPKVISNVLLHCGQVDKDNSDALVIQQIQRDRDKRQVEKQEKQRRRVTFVEKSTPEKPTANNSLKTIQKKPGELQEKKQFLQGFQLTARESATEISLESSSKFNELNAVDEINDTQNKGSVTVKKEDDVATETSNNVDDAKSKSNNENIGVNASGNATSANKRVTAMSGVTGNARVNTNKQCSDVDTCAFGYPKSTNAGMNTNVNSNPAKVDVYTFSNDPPVVPAGAVKRKCPPGLPIFDIKRKRQQQIQSQISKKQNPVHSPAVVQNAAKSPRKLPTEHVVPAKRLANIVGEAGPSRTPTTPSSKPASSPVLSHDTRNILDGCGLNIPASLSITLTAPKSPGNSGGFTEPNDAKDNRKNTLGKVSPSITLNDRSVDPRVLKALKAGQIRMPAPSKPRQTKQSERDANQQRQAPPAKRKRDQESRDILDLSGGKKMDIHPLRIPQPVTKLKAKSTVRDMPSISDQGQVVTLVGGHRYYRAPPGSLTPAAHRVNDCPIPTPTRTPVYAPGFSSPLNNARSNTNLSSVFPSLQSLYALSQTPNLQQFQMDARLRLPQGTDSNSTNVPNTDNRNINNNASGKSHLAAQCAPVKPARSSVAPLAVAITKQQQSNEKSACINRSAANEPNKTPVFRNNESLDSTESSQQLSVQTKYSPVAEANNRYSPRCTNNGNTNSEDKTPTEVTRDSNLETGNDSRKEPDNSSRQTPHREAASPRVSSTASPSPPPGDTNANTINETTSGHNDNVNTASNGIDNDLPAPSPTKKNNIGAEVSSSKSPASPDSSSVTIESPSNKGCSATVEQGCPSPSQTSDAVKSSEHSTKIDNNVAEDSTNDNDKKATIKQADAKQLTSEMFQKRLLAAFPSNEWANNPIAAEHLGNFLKSLNASIKSENKMDSIGSEKVESQLACNDATRLNNEASSKSRTDVAESS